MKSKIYCNKLVKVTMRDETVKFFHFTKFNEYKVFMEMVYIFRDVERVECFDNVHSKLVEIILDGNKTISRPYVPMKKGCSILKEVKHGKICDTSRYSTEISRSRKG